VLPLGSVLGLTAIKDIYDDVVSRLTSRCHLVARTFISYTRRTHLCRVSVAAACKNLSTAFYSFIYLVIYYLADICVTYFTEVLRYVLTISVACA